MILPFFADAVLFGIAIFIIFAGTAYERGDASLLGLALGVLFVWWLTPFDPVSWAIHNPAYLVVGLLAYFLIGALWARFKFGLWLHDSQEQMQSEYTQWQRQQQSTGNSNPTMAQFRESFGARYRPTANKARILTWMSWWVPSVLWTFLHDFVHRVWEAIYGWMSNLFEKASDKAFNKLK